MARRRDSDAGQSRRRRVKSCRRCRYRRCKKNYPSVLFCICKRTREGSDRSSEVRQFTANETGKGQFFWGNLRNLAGEWVVSKTLSPIRIAVCLIFAMTGPSDMGKGEGFSGFGEQACLPVHYREVQHDRGPSTESLELYGRRGPKYSERTLEKRPRPIECGCKGFSEKLKEIGPAE